MPDAPRIPCGEHVAYYSSWQTDTWQCPCGWTGTGKDAAWEPFDALVQVDCPQCDKRLCLVSYPSDEEHREAAARGDAEAIRAVDQMAVTDQWRTRLAQSKLYDPKQLPFLEGVDRIDLVLDGAEENGDTIYVLTANGEAIHKEIAAWETIAPLPRMLRHAVARYGDRIASFRVEGGAFMYLAGDSLAYGHDIEEMLTATGFDAADGHRIATDHRMAVPATLQVCINDDITIHDQNVDTELIAREVARIHAAIDSSGGSFAIANHIGDDETFVQIALTEGRTFLAEIHDPSTADGSCLTRQGVDLDEASRIISEWLAGHGAVGDGWTTRQWDEQG